MPRPTLQTVTTNQAADGTTLPVTYPASIAAGDLLLLAYCRSNTMNLPSGWTQGTESNAAGAVLTGYLWKIADGTETGSFNLTFTASSTLRAILMRFSPCSILRNPLTANDTSAGTTQTAPTQNPVALNEICVSICGAGASFAGTPTATITGTNWNKAADCIRASATSMTCAYNQVSTGSVTGNGVTWSLSAANGHSSITVLLAARPDEALMMA